MRDEIKNKISGIAVLAGMAAYIIYFCWSFWEEPHKIKVAIDRRVAYISNCDYKIYGDSLDVIVREKTKNSNDGYSYICRFHITQITGEYIRDKKQSYTGIIDTVNKTAVIKVYGSEGDESMFPSKYPLAGSRVVIDPQATEGSKSICLTSEMSGQTYFLMEIWGGDNNLFEEYENEHTVRF